MATVTAQLNNLRQAPRKVRMVVGVVKGKSALKALEQLEFIVRRPALPISKLLRSAIANAENNFQMVPSNLYIKEFYVDEGVKLKRFMPKARGAAGEIQKKTSHLYLVLAEKVPGMKAEKSAKGGSASGGKISTKEDEHTHDHSHETQSKMKIAKPQIKTEIGTKMDTSAGTKRRWFQRKSI